MKKIALITGATSGIGEACARRFADGGYDLIITGRRAEKLAAIKEDIEAQGTKVKTLTFDVRDADAAEAAINSLEPEWRNLDVLINNAGLALGLDKEFEGDPVDWNTMIDTNIKGLLTMTRLIVPDMSLTLEVWPEMRHTPAETCIALPKPPSKLFLTDSASMLQTLQYASQTSNPVSWKQTSVTSDSMAIHNAPTMYIKEFSRSQEQISQTWLTMQLPHRNMCKSLKS